jgi:outer membrane protein OmpA-like peptidoglycan-associated protein
MIKVMKPRLVVLGILLVLAGTGTALAQETDAEGCKDHPMLSRMKNYYISECKKRFDSHDFSLTDGTEKAVEGQTTTISYHLQEGAQQPSPLQIRRNYENAIKSLGGTILCTSDLGFCGRILKNGKEAWVDVQVYNDGNIYQLTIVEIEAMVQEVTADAMYDALSKDGFIALYINFDTGKSEIKPEAQGTIDQIAALMNGHADLKIGIEGHTDNVGTPASNKTLSEQRAKAVMTAVVAKGVAAARMTAVGWGQEKPIADNRSEDGRAKNRRVEIVKK